MRILLLGAPGAGKGTQAKELAKKLRLPHISTGDLLRQNVASGTALGMQAKDFMNKGALVPDELVNKMLTERFKAADVAPGFILDGYPRNLNQAKSLDEILKENAMSIDLVVYLDASETIIVQRICGRLVCSKCGANFHKTNMPPKTEMTCDHCGGSLYQRSDDKEETIKQRLTVYKNEVSSLIDYYSRSNKLERIPADDDAPVVLDSIIRLVSRNNDPTKV